MFAVGVGMLLSDVQVWESSLLGSAQADSFLWPSFILRGLHWTAAAALLPMVVWLFTLSALDRKPRGARARSDRTKTRRPALPAANA